MTQNYETKTYLYESWEFVEPLSLRSQACLSQFKYKCELLEDFLFEMGAPLKNFSFGTNDYNILLHLDFYLVHYDRIQEKRFGLYNFLNTRLPISYINYDWMNDYFIRESLSFSCKNDENNYFTIILALNTSNLEAYYPSHDFICMSEDLMNSKKIKAA